jgi:glycosyltransferase involved in cell wall biosynthesis
MPLHAHAVWIDTMKIGYLVARLGRGGAELQIMSLARAMAAAGHEVQLLPYDGDSPFDDDVRTCGVEVVHSDATGKRAKVAVTRAWLRTFAPDVLHAVMKRASSVALLARLPQRSPAVVATDLSTATYNRRNPVLWASLLTFALADRVVTQTELNRGNLERLAPWLRGKTEVIRNGLDVVRFVPPAKDRLPPDARPFRFCVAGTVYAVKNPERVVRAVAELRRRGRSDFRVDWYGRFSRPNADGGPGDVRPDAVALAASLGVDDLIRFHGEVSTIEAAYHDADALLHASVQEGFPNVVAEAMATGLPLVVSTVSELPLVVQTASNGYLFDPRDVASIADAMERMLDTPDAERRAMGQRSRQLAVSWFSLERFASDFERLYRSLAARA